MSNNKYLKYKKKYLAASQIIKKLGGAAPVSIIGSKNVWLDDILQLILVSFTFSDVLIESIVNKLMDETIYNDAENYHIRQTIIENWDNYTPRVKGLVNANLKRLCINTSISVVPHTNGYQKCYLSLLAYESSVNRYENSKYFEILKQLVDLIIKTSNLELLLTQNQNDRKSTFAHSLIYYCWISTVGNIVTKRNIKWLATVFIKLVDYPHIVERLLSMPAHVYIEAVREQVSCADLALLYAKQIDESDGYGLAACMIISGQIDNFRNAMNNTNNRVIDIEDIKHLFIYSSGIDVQEFIKFDYKTTQDWQQKFLNDNLPIWEAFTRAAGNRRIAPDALHLVGQHMAVNQARDIIGYDSSLPSDLARAQEVIIRQTNHTSPNVCTGNNDNPNVFDRQKWCQLAGPPTNRQCHWDHARRKCCPKDQPDC